MTEPGKSLDSFLKNAGWSEAARLSIAGDASARRYYRLRRPSGETAVLMDAGMGAAEETAAFAAIAQHLRSLGLSAPALLAEDPAFGLLLLEDLGDEGFTRLLERDPSREASLYTQTAEALAVVQGARPPQGLTRFDPAYMADLVRITFDWYRPAVAEVPAHDMEGFLGLLEDTLADLAPNPSALALRDFHAGNLIWLADRTGPARVGLLDFQDAVVAHPAYDLVSLLHDARREVSESTRASTTRRFLDLTGLEHESFAAAAAVVSVQRNLRILGVFARLALRDGKTAYLRFLPRVHYLIRRELAHPRLAALAAGVAREIPPPDAAALSRLEATCATAAR